MKNLKKSTLVILLSTILVVSLTSVYAFCADADAETPVSHGPAPNSGDGVPDGSGYEGDDWPNNGKGPAPNSGDGVPDGSGF